MKFFFALFSLFVFASLGAQEEHFSDYTNTSVFLNPAYTGYIPGKHNNRFSVSGRDQWSSILGDQAYRTVSAAYDGRICGKTEGDFIGLGARFLGDWQGDPVIRKSAGYFSLGYTKKLSGWGKEPERLIGVGAEVGFVNYSLSIPDLTFDDQFDDPTIPDEVFLSSSPSFLDYSVGAHYYDDEPDRLFRQLILAVSVKHINQPKIGFLGNTLGGSSSSDSTAFLAPRWNAQFGFSVELGKRQSLSFLSTYSWQKPHNQLLSRIMLNFRERDDRNNLDNKTFAIGLGLRLNNGFSGVGSESMVLLAQWHLSNLIFAINGDLNIGKLGLATKGAGAIEFSASFLFSGGNGKCFYCRGA